MKSIVFTRQDNIEVEFSTFLKNVEDLGENFLIKEKKVRTYLEQILFHAFDLKRWTLNELLFFAKNNKMIVLIYNEDNILIKRYDYN